MPHEIDLESAILRIRVDGHVSAAELTECAEKLDRMEDALPTTPNRIVDLGTAVVVVDFFAILAVAERRIGHRYPNAFKSAIVAPEPAQFGTARMYASLVHHPQIEVGVFTDLQEAEAWIDATASVPMEHFHRLPHYIGR